MALSGRGDNAIYQTHFSGADPDDERRIGGALCGLRIFVLRENGPSEHDIVL